MNEVLHITAIALGLGACSAILARLNALKAERKKAGDSVSLLDNGNNSLVLPAHYAILLSGYVVSVLFDYYVPTSLSWAYTTLLAYVIGYASSLVDFYVSQVESMPVMEILPGMALWSSSSLVVACFQHYYLSDANSEDLTILNPREILSLRSLGWQYCAFLVNLLCRGFFTDLFFSPLHRYMHVASHYQTQHKKHHAYVRSLTNLVLYYGTLLDDFLMPVTTVLGGFLSLWLEDATGRTGLLNPSNLVTTMILTQLPYSHASDQRLASLFCPLPKSLNFIDYHLQHHLDPQTNFGLLVITDMIWDAILGTTTVAASHSIKREQRAGVKAQ